MPWIGFCLLDDSKPNRPGKVVIRFMTGERVRSAVAVLAAWIGICAVLVTLFPLAVAPAGAPAGPCSGNSPELATLDVCNLQGSAVSTNGHTPGLCVAAQIVPRPRSCPCWIDPSEVVLPHAPVFSLEYPPRA